MKVAYLLLFMFTLVISSCAGSPGPASDPSSEDSRLDPLKEYAAKSLGLNKDEIIFTKTVQQEWPDACLGLPEKEEMCAMVVTPGHQVTFTTPQGLLEFHTNEDMSYFRMAPVGSPTMLVTWQRSGGIAGICEELKILSDNSYSLSECSGSILAEGNLSDTDITELDKFIKQYTVTDWFSTQPQGSADMFNDHFILYGKGEENAGDSHSNEINEWIAGLVSRLKLQENTK